MILPPSLNKNQQDTEREGSLEVEYLSSMPLAQVLSLKAQKGDPFNVVTLGGGIRRSHDPPQSISKHPGQAVALPSMDARQSDKLPKRCNVVLGDKLPL